MPGLKRAIDFTRPTKMTATCEEGDWTHWPVPWSAAGHTGSIVALDFSTDSARYVTASEDGTARLWRAADGGAIATLLGHSGPVLSAAWALDDSVVATGGADRTVRLWNPASGEQRRVLSCGFAPGRIVFDRAGRMAVLSNEGASEVWEIGSYRRLFSLESRGWRPAILSPDRRRITRRVDSAVCIHDLATGAELHKIPAAPFEPCDAIALSPDMRIVVFRYMRLHTDYPSLLFWETDPPHLRRTIYDAEEAAFSPDGRHVAVMYRSGGAILDATSGEALVELETGAEEAFGRPEFSPDGRYLTASRRGAGALVWNTGTGRLHCGIAVPTASRPSDFRVFDFVQFAPDGRRIATCSRESGVELWSPASGRLEHVTPAHGPRPAFFGEPAGRPLLLTVADRHRIELLWAGEAKTRPVAMDNGRAIDSVVPTPDGRMIATAAGEIRFRSTQDGSEIRRVSWTVGECAGRLEFTRDGSRFIVADHTPRLRDVSSGRPMLLFHASGAWATAAAVSADALKVATVYQDGMIRLWDAKTGQRLRELRGHAGAARSVQFSADGSRIITTGDDGFARIWALAGADEPVSLGQHEGPVNFAAFGAEDELVVTVSMDRTARIWNAVGGKILAILRHDAWLAEGRISTDGARVYVWGPQVVALWERAPFNRRPSVHCA